MFQPRFIAYLLHTNQEPEDVKNHHFTAWVSEKWREYEKVFGEKAPYTEEQHKQFTEWLFETAPEGQLLI